MEEFSSHYLKTSEGLRAANRAAKNILDWGLNERLPAIRKQLDALIEKVEKAAAEKEAAEKEAAEKEAAEKEAAEKAAVEKATAVASEGDSVKTGPRKGRNRNGRKRKSPVSTVAAQNARDEPSTERASRRSNQ
jgi:translation initiation factor 4G